MKTDYYGVIYKITNLINNKIYIGQSINPKQRWSSHKSSSKNHKKRCRSLIAMAIYEYNEENFTFEVIDYAQCQKSLNKLEEHYINILNSLNPNGYNLLSSYCGDYILDDEIRLKIRKGLINRKHKNSTSIYFGVYFIEKTKMWQSYIKYKSKRIYIGCFNTEKEAAIKRDIYIINNKHLQDLDLNFPELKEEYLNIQYDCTKRNRTHQKITKCKNLSSKYKGVRSVNKFKKKWVASVKYNKKRYYLGTFDKEIDAAIAVNNKLIEFYGEDAKLNIID